MELKKKLKITRNRKIMSLDNKRLKRRDINEKEKKEPWGVVISLKSEKSLIRDPTTIIV